MASVVASTARGLEFAKPLSLVGDVVQLPRDLVGHLAEKRLRDIRRGDSERVDHVGAQPCRRALGIGDQRDQGDGDDLAAPLRFNDAVSADEVDHAELIWREGANPGHDAEPGFRNRSSVLVASA